MKVLIVTVVHHPGDARIAAREIRALLEAGHEVVYAAPFSGYGVEPPEGVTAHDLPRSVGRSRIPAVRAARALIAREGPATDVVLLHDPELLLAATKVKNLPPVVWDVHEDTAAAVTQKPWLPPRLRPLVSRAFLTVERIAERNFHLMLAEAAYQERFKKTHPFIPNTTPVPESVPAPDEPRVVYVGHNSRARGALDIIAAAKGLVAEGITVDVVGHADDTAAAALRAASEEGVLTWHGFVPNAEALALVEGATAGLSLLRDEPNFRHSMITKIVEYMAHGVPIIATPLPLVRDAVERYDVGIVVPFTDAGAVVDAVRKLRADPELRHAMGARGHATAREKFSWEAGAAAFVTALREWARDPAERTAAPGA